jgi:hypothetical protein
MHVFVTHCWSEVVCRAHETFHRHELYAVFRCDLDYDAGCKGLRTVIPNIETSMNFGSQSLLTFMVILVLETEIKDL